MSERKIPTPTQQNEFQLVYLFLLSQDSLLGGRVSLSQDQVWIETYEDAEKYPEFSKKGEFG